MSLEGRLEKLERMVDACDDGPIFMLLGEHEHPTSAEGWTEAERAAAREVAHECHLKTGQWIVVVKWEDVRTWLESHGTGGGPQ